MRIPTLLLALMLVAGACSDDSSGAEVGTNVGPTSTTTAMATTTTHAPIAVEDIAGFIIGDVPEGYRAVHADDRGALAEVSYDRRPCVTFDWDAQVRLTEEYDFWSGRPGDHEPHALADGSEVEILDLWDDGRSYGYGASWELSDGRWVTVRYDGHFSVDDLRAGIDSLIPIDATEWERLRRALSIDTHVNRVDPDAEDVIVELDPIDGSPITVTFHVPGDYPLGDDDCRRACFSLQAADAAFLQDCNTHPTPVRHDGSILVAALVAPIVETVWIDAGRSVIVADDERREASTVAIPGMADRFFVVQVPTDWCHWVVTSPDADFGSGLSEGGFITSDPRYAGCERDLEPAEYEQPEGCFEVSHDWVASTTSLSPRECFDERPAASTSTTVPADDE